MYHPTQREMIVECFDTQLLRWMDIDDIGRLFGGHRTKYDYMCTMYVKAVEDLLPDNLAAFRAGRDVLVERFDRENIRNWMDTDKLITLQGEEICIPT